MSSAERCAHQATNPGRVLALLLVVCWMGLPIAAQPQSTQETAPLTYQLYSWEDANGGWNFSVLHDTNHQKTVAEVFNPKVTLKGLDQLKRKLSDGRKIVHILDAFVKSALKDDPALLRNWNLVKRVPRPTGRAAAGPSTGATGSSGPSSSITTSPPPAPDPAHAPPAATSTP